MTALAFVVFVLELVLVEPADMIDIATVGFRTGFKGGDDKISDEGCVVLVIDCGAVAVGMDGDKDDWVK